MFAALILTALASGAGLTEPAYFHLGFLDPLSNGPSLAFAVSPDGNVVVGESNSDQGIQAFAWTEQLGMHGLGDLPGGAFFSAAYGVSRAGRRMVIVGASEDCCSGEGGTPFAFALRTRMFALPTLEGPTSYGQAQAVTPDGRIAVGASQIPSGDIDAVLWERGVGIVDLGDLPGGRVLARAQAISADGRVVVGTGSTDSFGFDTAFRWTEETGMEPLPGTGRTAALGISSDGQVVVGQVNGHAGRWTDQTGWVDLGTFGSGVGLYYASGVNADGSVIVGLGNFNPTQGTGEAYIWDDVNGMRSLASYLQFELGLSLNGLYPFWAWAMSPDARVIAGYGFNIQGEQEAFVARTQ
jgi:probable HAF family extracellular repeat protein